jgi:hypothetical protein
MKLQGMGKNSSQSILIPGIIALYLKVKQYADTFITITLFKVKTCMYDECGTADRKELQGGRRILKFINEI